MQGEKEIAVQQLRICRVLTSESVFLNPAQKLPAYRHGTDFLKGNAEIHASRIFITRSQLF